MKINWTTLIICFLITFSTAIIGGQFTSPNTNTQWYQEIKPEITPQNYIFPIVWNILFTLIAISLYLAWTNAKNKKLVASVFGINFSLNILWSFLFFYLQKPSFALIEIFFLEVSILSLIITNYKINKTSAYLLIPYLLWVGFAIILNWLTVFS